MQGGEVLGTVAQQRHPLFGKVSEHQFAGFSRGNRFEGLRVYNLGEVMVFIEVGTVLALAFVTYTGTGNLTKPINIKCLFRHNRKTHCGRLYPKRPFSMVRMPFTGKTGVFDGICQIEGV